MSVHLIDWDSKVKFGKLDNVDEVDFTLPQLTESDKSIISQKAERLRFMMGCTGWSTKEWKGNIFPPKAKTEDFLGYYAESFDTIEMNTTHYRIPKVEQVLKWKSQVRRGFEFCPKIPQSISHSRTLGVGDSKLLDFCLKISSFEDNLGPCFMQLPTHFSIDKLPALEEFCKVWPRDMQLSIEFRHPSIYEDNSFRRVQDLLTKYNKGFVVTDVAGRRDMAKILLTAPYLLVRFVGNNFHPSDYSRASQWCNIAYQYQQMGLDKIHFFVHEPDNTEAPKLADYIAKELASQPTIDVQDIRWYGGKQLTLF